MAQHGSRASLSRSISTKVRLRAPPTAQIFGNGDGRAPVSDGDACRCERGKRGNDACIFQPRARPSLTTFHSFLRRTARARLFLAAGGGSKDGFNRPLTIPGLRVLVQPANRHSHTFVRHVNQGFGGIDQSIARAGVESPRRAAESAMGGKKVTFAIPPIFCTARQLHSMSQQQPIA